LERTFPDQPGSRFCYRLEQAQRDWGEALHACRQDGGDLASIHSQDEVQFLFDWCMTTYGTNCWVGANDLAVEGNWVWTDGTPSDYFDFWCCHEPDDAWGGQDRMMIWQNWEGQGPGSDETCSNQHPSFCKLVL
jgi:hypothetical protein